MESKLIDVLALQEPYTYDNLVYLPGKYRIISNNCNDDKRPKAVLVIQNSQLVIVEDSDFIHPNIATGVLHLNNNEKIILVSLYVNIKEFRRLT